MSPTVLSKVLGVELQPCPEDNPARCALSDQYGQYVLDDQNQIIALNLFGYQKKKKRPALPPTNKWLADLPHLKYLNLARCGLTELDLTAQENLVILFAQENEALNKIKFPAAFPALLRADLSQCYLTTIIWPASPVLEVLNVSRQHEKELEEWQFSAPCPLLYLLDLSHNRLADFQLGPGFTRLGILCLENNALDTVVFTGQLPGLESLRLNDNLLTSVSGEWLNYAPNLLNLHLEKNNIEDHYKIFIEDKTPYEALTSLRDLFKNEALGTEKDDECKVMIIGNGKAGKSTIVKRLKDGKFRKNYVSTHGIELFAYPQDNWKLVFWDFGGQDVYHATHRLFMQSNVVYLLVWSPDTDPTRQGYQQVEENGEVRQYRNYSIPYWLHYADTIGEGSPIVLVQTHKNNGVVLAPPGLTASDVKPAYIHQIESSEPDFEKSGYEDMIRYLTRSVKKLKAASGAMTASNILEMRQLLRDRLAGGQRIMSLEEYLVEAERLKINGAEDVLKSWLHKTGVLFYQPQRLGGRIILDQQWAIDAIYTMFDRSEPHFKRLKEVGGVFRGMELEAIWKSWPEADPELFVEFMLSCEVCFELPSGEQELAYRSFMVPGLLPEMPDDSFVEMWAGRPYWEVHFCYEILHYGVVQRFLVKTQQIASRGKMTQVSTILFDEPQVATVEAKREQEYLDRMVVRIGKNDYQLLGQIANVLADIQQAVPKVLIRTSENEHLVSFKRIDAAFRVNDQTVETTTGSKVSVHPFYDFWNHRAKGRLVGEGQALAMLSDEEVMKHLRNFARADASENKPKEIIRFPAPTAPQAGPAPTTGTGSSLPPGLKTILFVSANPQGTAPLKLKEELWQIMDGLRGSTTYQAELLPEVTESKFVNEIFTVKPHILHFSGHGEKAAAGFHSDGIIFNDDQGGDMKLVSTTMLKKFFTALRESVDIPLKYIVLNSCYSHLQAKAISEEGYVVVGTSTSISDNAAVAFSKGFYQALGRGEEVRSAVSQGRKNAGFKELGETKVLIYEHGEIVEALGND